jgi:hypothetical protein
VASIKSESLGYRPLENAIAAARTFSKDVDMQVGGVGRKRNGRK